MSMASSSLKSLQETASWVQHVHEVQSKRTPEAVAAARQRIEQARQSEVTWRKCRAFQGHSLRTRALAAEGLRQMSLSAPAELQDITFRWGSAQAASKSRQDRLMSLAVASPPTAEAVEAQALGDLDDEEDEALLEVAALVGAKDTRSMAAIGESGQMEAWLQQLRQEPTDEDECAAKFMLYDGYSSHVQQMRDTLLDFHRESRATVPAEIARDMDKKVRGIDSQAAMGIRDHAHGWFVFHMMRRAEQNNLSMAKLLDKFEKTLKFLRTSSQTECPICLEDFEEGGSCAPETLACCHKVCKGCWEHWKVVMGGRAFCPLCRNDDFLGAVARRVSAHSMDED